MKPADRSKEAFSRLWDSLGIDNAVPLAPEQILEPKTLDIETLPQVAPYEPQTHYRKPAPWLQQIVLSGEGRGIPDFEVLERIGEGGMGQIDLVRQNSLQREIVIKSLKPEHKTPQNFQSLLREALITGSLQHPNIVPVHMLAKNASDEPLLLMKRIEGVSWKELLLDASHPAWKKLPGERLVRHLEILTQVATAIDFAHSKGIVHRDIKPRNVMIGDFGEVYVLDWGIALRLEEREADLFQGPVGTPSYMAPEMLEGSTKISPKTDVYLLGATLHEILVGKTRHQGADFNEILFSAFQSEPYNYPKSVPKELASICHKAMHPEPDLRFESAAAFRQAVTDYLQKRAALKLLAEAQGRLVELRELLSFRDQAEQSQKIAANRRRIYKVFFECRFGFEQYLKDYEKDTAARAGLNEGLTLMFQYESSQENVAAAQELLEELEGSPNELRRQLEALVQRKREEKDSQEKLKELQHQTDLAVNASHRGIAMFIWLGLATLGTIVLQVLRSMGVLQNRLLSSFFLILGLLFYIVFRLLQNKQQLFKTAINQNMIRTLALALVAMLVNRTVGLFLQSSLPQVILIDCLLLWPLLAMLALFVHRRFLISMGFYLAGVVLCLVAPSYSPEIMISITVVGIGLALFRLGRDKHQEPNEAAPSSKPPRP